MKFRTTTLASAVCLILLAQTATANEYTELIKGKKYPEAERAATAKLAQDPNNADALVAKVELVIEQGLESRYGEAEKLAEQCIAAHPKTAACHEALGHFLAIKTQSVGALYALTFVGKMRDAFKKSLELDPSGVNARFSLLQFYLHAPGLMGGGTDKAEALQAASAKINPDAAKLMQALIDYSGQRFAKAETTALTLNIGGADALAEHQRSILYGLGLNYMAEKKYQDAGRMFLELQKRYPESEIGYYGLGRTLQEQGKNGDAASAFAKALSIEASARSHYRLGQCLQAGNEKAKATSAFEKALAFKPPLDQNLKSDVEEQLKSLKN